MEKAPKEPELLPGEYLPLKVMTFPKDQTGVLPESFHKGTNQAKTVAYIFNYSFDIVVDPDFSGASDFCVDSHAITVYPPFASRPANRPFVDAIPLETIPYRENTIAPSFDWMSAVPEVKLSAEQVAMRRDSLRVDCSRELPYEFAADVAERLIGLIRWHTKQWWILRGREHSRTHVRQWFQANELGERLSGIGLFAFFYGKMGFERPLRQEDWPSIIASLAAGNCIPLSWDIFFDAIYFHSNDDLRRCVLELAISNEALLAETLVTWVEQGRIEKSEIDRVLAGNDFLDHLARAEELVESRFRDEQPVEFEWIKAIWIARGHVAHGKTPLAQGGRELTLKDMPNVFGSVVCLRQWLENILSGP